MTAIDIAGSIIALLLGLSVIAGATIVLARRGVVSQANEVITMLQSKVAVLEDTVSELRTANQSLRSKVSLLTDLVTGAAAVKELREHLDTRLDELAVHIQKGSHG